VKSLSAREKIFVAEYLVDFNAAKAAVRAGYSARSCGQPYRLLERRRVAEAIRDGIRERVAKLGIDADDVLLRALQIYDRAMAAEPVLKWDAASKRRLPTGEFAYDGALAAKALEMIAKLLGAFRDKPAGEERAFVVNIFTEVKDDQHR
jgi:phage terminase small subunit